MELNTRANSNRINELVCTLLDDNSVPINNSFPNTCFPFVLTGKGTYHYPDGRFYTGEYMDDRPHGQGTERSSDGAVLYDGPWALGEFIGVVTA